jgi:hypothetical protein
MIARNLPICVLGTKSPYPAVNNYKQIDNTCCHGYNSQPHSFIYIRISRSILPINNDVSFKVKQLYSK